MKIREVILESVLDEDLSARHQEQLLKSLDTYYNPYNIDIYIDPHAFTRVATRTPQSSEQVMNIIKYMIGEIIGTDENKIMSFRKRIQKETLDTNEKHIITGVKKPRPPFQVIEHSDQQYKLTFGIFYDDLQQFINHELPSDGQMKMNITTFYSSIDATNQDIDPPNVINIENNIDTSNLEDADQSDKWKSSTTLAGNKVALVKDILKRSILNVLENYNTLQAGLNRDETKKNYITRELTKLQSNSRNLTSDERRKLTDLKSDSYTLTQRIKMLNLQFAQAQQAKDMLSNYLLHPEDDSLQFDENQVQTLMNTENWSRNENLIDNALPEALNELENYRLEAYNLMTQLQTDTQSPEYKQARSAYRAAILKMNKFITPITKLAEMPSHSTASRLQDELDRIENPQRYRMRQAELEREQKAKQEKEQQARQAEQTKLITQYKTELGDYDDPEYIDILTQEMLKMLQQQKKMETDGLKTTPEYNQISNVYKNYDEILKKLQILYPNHVVTANESRNSFLLSTTILSELKLLSGIK